MKKEYIQPELLIVCTAHQLPLCLSGHDELGEAQLVKDQAFNWGSFWDEWAGAAGE